MYMHIHIYLCAKETIIAHTYRVRKRDQENTPIYFMCKRDDYCTYVSCVQKRSRK